MLALERQKIILEYLASNGVITTKHLSELTGASLATLRRDLNLLDSQGLLKKTHGGAQRIETKAAFLPGSSVVLEFDPFYGIQRCDCRKSS